MTCFDQVSMHLNLPTGLGACSFSVAADVQCGCLAAVSLYWRSVPDSLGAMSLATIVFPSGLAAS